MSSIAKKLSVTWHTAKSYVETWPETQQAFQDEREKIVDMAEATLFKSIREGDTGDAKWVLSRLGKDRGYVERNESKIDGTIKVPEIKWQDGTQPNSE